jgi:outer membrane protein assembly factor BamC
MPKLLLILLLLPALSGCRFLTGENGMFRDRAGAYKEAQILPPMRVPPELDSYTLDQLYVVPEQAALQATAFDRVPLPKPIETGRREGIIIQSLGEDRWILIDATPGQVWPLIRDYWTQLQVLLDYENPSAGIMETSWVEVDSDIETRHKYRISIEPGLHSGYSEIYIRHLQNLRSDPIPEILVWPEISTSPDRERQILDSLSQYLADRNDIYQASSASLLAGSIESERKANLVQTASGEQVLELRVNYNRAWVQVREALEAAKVVIVDSDRDQKIINVKFSGLESEDKPGLIGRMFGRGRDAELAALDFSLRLNETDTTVEVSAETDASSDSSVQLRDELLAIINDNLS